MKIGKFLLILFLIVLGTASICLLRFNTGSYSKLWVQLLELPNAATVKIEIGGYPYSMHVDLGSTQALALPNRYLKKIRKKKEAKTTRFLNIKGIVYESKNFQIPSVKVGCFKLADVILAEETETDSVFYVRSEKIKHKAIQRERKFIDGVIGLPIFKQFDCLFDFPNSQIHLAKDKKTLLDKSGYVLDNFIQVPFDLDKKGVILSAETDIGKMKFLLDTGATISILRKSLIKEDQVKEPHPGNWIFDSRSLVFSDKDLGSFSFLLYEFGDVSNEFDGFLGLDFFKKHAVYLDFRDGVAYIHP